MYEWDRQPTASGRLVARLTPAYHADLELLYDAHACAIDSLYGLESVDDRWNNWAGLGDKWFKSGGSWYYLLPNGALFLLRGKTATQLLGTQVAALDPSFYANPDRLSRAQSSHLSAYLGLHADGDVTPSVEAGGEKWILDRDRHWFFLTPGGSLHRWDGGPTASGPRVAVLDAADYADLAWLPSPVE